MSQRPLALMGKISDSVFVYHPTEDPSLSQTNYQSGPKAILILGWMDARESNLAYFINKYRILYPQSAIFLVKSSKICLSFAQLGRKNCQPVVEPLRSVLSTGDDDDDDEADSQKQPKLLIHLFSGGGSSALYHLYHHFRALSPPAVLPRHVTIFDSTPGQYSYSFARHIFTAGLTKSPLVQMLLAPFAHTIALVSYILVYIPLIRVLRIAKDDQTTWREAHNDPALVSEARRVYMYSDADKLTSYKVIESHADEAERKGFMVWGRELYKGAGHVGCARQDGERYWRVVGEVWEGRRKMEQ